MPEGHTIHRLAIDQTKSLARQTLRVTSPQGRFEEGAKQLDGRKLLRLDAAGKHLFYHFAARRITGLTDRPMLHIHLGLFGKYRTHRNPPPPPRGLVRIRFQSRTHTVDLNGPNQCELLTPAEAKDLLARLGPDPLRDDARPIDAWKKIHASRQSIGLLLMDQSVIAGLGNIYRSEILHLLSIHPSTAGTQITRPQFNKLWKLAVKLLTLGVKHNRIITIEESTLPKDVSRVSRKKLFRIFKKQSCPTCGGTIEQFKLAGRKVFACPSCQVLAT